MRIIAIDPGFDRIGLAVFEKTITSEELIFSNCFMTDKKSDIYTRLNSIAIYVNQILKQYSPEAIFIESIFFFKNQKTIINVASARGIIINECKNFNLKILEITPMQIKSAVTSDGHADKKQVEFMVKNILKNNIYFKNKLNNQLKKNDLLDDEIDAIACGLAGLAYFKKI